MSRQLKTKIKAFVALAFWTFALTSEMTVLAQEIAHSEVNHWFSMWHTHDDNHHPMHNDTHVPCQHTPNRHDMFRRENRHFHAALSDIAARAIQRTPNPAPDAGFLNCRLRTRAHADTQSPCL